MGKIYGSVPARRGFEAANAAPNAYVFNSLSTRVNVCNGVLLVRDDNKPSSSFFKWGREPPGWFQLHNSDNGAPGVQCIFDIFAFLKMTTSQPTCSL
jgi:hypothetical protein